LAQEYLEQNPKMMADIINSQPDQALAIADGQDDKSIDEMALYGLQIVASTKGPGSKAQGIQYVQDQKISVTRRSQKTIQAYQNYCWAQNVRNGLHQPVPDDTIHEWSNPMDAIRYGFNGAGSSSRIMERQKNQFIMNQNKILTNSSK